jgi:hypothetical protein
MNSFEYLLQRAPVGVVMVDAQRRVVAANPLACTLLEPVAGAILGADLLALHPAPARAKVEWMLDAALARPDQPVGMAMTLPMGTLIARVTTTLGTDGPGWCLVFHLPDRFGQPTTASGAEILVKLPVGSRAGVSLLDVVAAVYLEAEGHYTRIHTSDGQHFCPLAFADLGRRLDPSVFLRVHRSFFVNLNHAGAIDRSDGHWAIVMDAPGQPRVPVSRARLALVRRRLAV